MSSSPRARALALLVVVVLAGATLTSCRNGRIGARCRTADFGQDQANVLVCRGGRWRKLMTKGEYARILVAVARSKPPQSPVAQVSVGPGDDTCALLLLGTIECWGLNVDGISGQESGQLVGAAPPSHLTPVTVPGVSSAIDVSVSSTHACAVLADSSVRCWGNDEFNALGNGRTGSDPVRLQGPVVVSGLAGAKQVVATTTSSCALLTSGDVRCWGLHDETIGDGVTASASVGPTAVVGVHGAIQLAAGQTHVCALLTTGMVACWGVNHTGEVGDAAGAPHAAPITVPGVDGVTSIAASVGSLGADGITCGVRASGSVTCWGDNRDGKIQPGGPTVAGPSTIAGVGGVRTVDLAGSRGCVTLTDGRAACWGTNSAGALGDGSGVDHALPGGVQPDVADVEQVSTGGSSTCLVTNPGRLFCMGERTGHGELVDAVANRFPREVVF